MCGEIKDMQDSKIFYGIFWLIYSFDSVKPPYISCAHLHFFLFWILGFLVYYRTQTKFSKVMFSQVSVCPQGECLPHCMLGYTPPLGPEADTPQADTPPADTPHPVHTGIRSTNGRYASHWNAFLFDFKMKQKFCKGSTTLALLCEKYWTVDFCVIWWLVKCITGRVKRLELLQNAKGNNSVTLSMGPKFYQNSTCSRGV